MIALLGAALAGSPLEAEQESPGRTIERFCDFSSDPGWEGHRNRLLTRPLPTARQAFGHQRVGARQPTGAIGGSIQRSVAPAWYAERIDPCTLDERLSAAGQFSISRCDNGSGLMFGWFNSRSRGWRTPNSVAFRLDGNGGKYWVLFEYGTRNWLTGGGATFEGRYQTTSTPPLPADGSWHAWQLDYDPEGNGGDGVLRFTLDGVVYQVDLAPGHRADGATMDRFGVWNVQMSGESLDFAFKSLVRNSRPIALDEDPGWEGVGNQGTYPQRFVRPLNDYGYVDEGEARGQIGGVVWRDTPGTYYADRFEPLSLDDRLRAEGTITFKAAASDSAVCFGWFDADSRRQKAPGGAQSAKADPPPRANLLAIMVEGPSRVGHYFRPEYATASGLRGLRESGPLIKPDGSPHRWSLDYDPRGAGGRGLIAFSLDDEAATFELAPGHRSDGATFNRFGILGTEGADGHFVEVYLDNLRYTAAGDAR